MQICSIKWNYSSNSTGGFLYKSSSIAKHKHLHKLFSCFWQHFCRILSCFICKNVTLPLLKKDVFVRNAIFLKQDRFLSSWNKLFSLYFKLFLQAKVSQNTLSFKQIESYMCSFHWLNNSRTRRIDLLTREFDFLTLRFEFSTPGFAIVTCGFQLITRRFVLITRELELVTRKVELLIRQFELVGLN